MIEYMYTHDYTDDPPDLSGMGTKKTSSRSSARKAGHVVTLDTNVTLEHHVLVNSIADFFQIDGLIALANNKIRIKGGLPALDSEPFVSALFTEHEVIFQLPDAINRAIGSPSDEGVKDILATIASNHLNGLIVTDGLKKINAVSDFAAKPLVLCEDNYDKKLSSLTTQYQ
jgi:hypothetical protein